MAMFQRDSLFGKKEEAAHSGTESAPAAAGREAVVESKLIVGAHIKLKGVEITDCDTLVVEGRVEASMDSRVVQIAAGAVFIGTATMDVAEIHGTFEGKLTVRKQLVIYSTGRVSGEICYGKMRIEEGGQIAGQLSILPAAQNVPATSTSESKTTPWAAKHLASVDAQAA
jgi:cytoskeletal protein CcmA (bactofilin family)